MLEREAHVRHSATPASLSLRRLHRPRPTPKAPMPSGGVVQNPPRLSPFRLFNPAPPRRLPELRNIISSLLSVRWAVNSCQRCTFLTASALPSPPPLRRSHQLTSSASLYQSVDSVTLTQQRRLITQSWVRAPYEAHFWPLGGGRGRRRRHGVGERICGLTRTWAAPETDSGTEVEGARC